MKAMNFLEYAIEKFNELSPIELDDYHYQDTPTRKKLEAALIEQGITDEETIKSLRRCLANAAKKIKVVQVQYSQSGRFSILNTDRLETAFGYLEAYERILKGRV